MQGDRPENTLNHLEDYARFKRLKPDFLLSLGLTQDERGLLIPYRDAQGEVTAIRCRHPEGAATRFSWLPQARLLPYGLWMALNQQARGLILCEGESDAHTLWQLDLPALGIPGAASFQTAWAPLMRDRPLWLHQENDQGGQTFIARTVELLRKGGFRGPLYRFAASDIEPDCKDISALYLKLDGPAAVQKLREQMAARQPVQEPAAANPPAAPLPPAFRAYEARTLYGATLPRPMMVLDRTLTAGLSLLAGAPKKGKSWLALALAMAVAEGERMLNRATRKGEVLYLDLESRQYRVQERLSQLRPGEPPAGLFITHQAPRLGDGLMEALDSWVKAHPQTALIIIDTLARIKCPGQGGENAYEADTRLMGALQRFALDHGLCMLLIHHLRKTVSSGRESDVYERVSGSTGLTGVCDCVLVLDGKRQEQEAQLYVDGRDIPPAQLALHFDQGRWTLSSEDGAAYQRGLAYESSPLPRALRTLMEGRAKWEGTASELAEALGRLDDRMRELDARSIGGRLDQLSEELIRREGLQLTRIKLRGIKKLRITRTGAPGADAPADDPADGEADTLPLRAEVSPAQLSL